VTHPHDHFHGDAVDLKMPPHDPATARWQLKAYAELARTWGLHVTSGADATQPKEQTMPLTNPYDRRGDSRRGDAAHDFALHSDAVDRGVSIERELRRGPVHGTSPQSGRPLYDVAGQRLEMADEVDPPGLTLRDLEQLVAMKVKRARRDGDDAAYMRGRQELVDAQRQAWAEGAHVGAVDRGTALHAAFEEEFGAKVHDLHQRAVAILDAAPAGEKPTTAEGRALRTVEHLLALVRDVAKVTDEAIVKHDRELRHFAQTGHTNVDIPF
jgi:hypothetical protein